jgi:hypothetical protein
MQTFLNQLAILMLLALAIGLPVGLLMASVEYTRDAKRRLSKYNKE